ncbi:MAG TPA: GNAT family N-acyltransferase [Candidatus Eisenbacteria bacterium]|nr:GNAT family N-acyltransferase [Candidatus Eisenbacteria bacterium]
MSPAFEIKITTDPAEVREAQKLRFEVFNLELNKGLKASYETGLDADEFDPYCEHLIVRDRSSGEVIGTYRLLHGARARAHIGFYSEREFNLENIKRLDGELLELGRTCARKDFRERALIPLMWEAIGQYIRERGIRFLFGCGSLYTTEVQEVAEVFSMLKRSHYAEEAYRVDPLPHCRFEGLEEDAAIADAPSVFVKLPSLIKGYLRVGAVVCGPPALDREFGTADFFLLLDFNTLGSDYLRRLRIA